MTHSERVERVLVLLEGGGDAMVEAAAELAAGRGLPLVGILVEDVDLLSSAGLPFAREIGLVSGRARPLSAAGIERWMQERSEQLRGQLQEIARRRGIEAALEVGRGRLAETVLARLQPDDLLVVRRTTWVRRPGGLVEAVLGGAACSVVLLGGSAPAPAAAGPMVLLDGSDGAERL